jgi:transcription-repair coupling factor (superfamily II helicase)
MSARDGFLIWFEQLERSARQQHLGFTPASSPAQAFAAIAIQKHTGRPVLWVVENEMALAQALRDLHALEPAGETAYLPFPPVYGESAARQHADLDGTGTRLQTLHRIADLLLAGQAPVIVAPLAACMQPTISPSQIRKLSCRVEIGSVMAINSIRQFLEANGYDHEAEVLEKGQYAGRGGILDVWPADTEFPIRLEWFGDEIESIRYFDPITQRTVEKTDTIVLSPLQDIAGASGNILDHIPEAAAIIWHDYQRALDALDETENASERENLAAMAHPAAETRIIDFGCLSPQADLPAFTVLEEAVHLPATSGTAKLTEARQAFIAFLVSRKKQGWNIRLYFDTVGTRDHFLHHLMPAGKPDFQIEIGSLSEGFACPAIRTLYAAESDMYGRKRFPAQTETVARKAKRYAGSRINDFTDIEPGDLVVHTDHGVGRYLGVQIIQFNHKSEEVLAIEYADDAKLYVPVAHAHLLSRYVGMAGAATSLHRLGGKRWAREKTAAQTAVMDLAAELLEMQARRNLLQGHAFAPDSPLQHEFDHAFPFVETADQVQVIAEVKTDMEATRPMDRLICGDAGYGKTEVAMRAAFKAVEDKMQVAMLVPTTVLAQQHFQTFSERMAGFDVRIAVISRFQTVTQRKRILEALHHGAIDIIIGTHALVQPGIRFANLGLVIIDEEQRFGVAHKERLKKLRALVDVLTLSATPIPRTLYMSMTGARDLSLLRTAPRERVPIETIVTTTTDEHIVDAIRYEHRRGGQVYFLHNRVVSINKLREKLSAMLPEVRIEVAHGRMHANDLAAVMQRFVAGKIDVLLCTTIIESGVDIPRANTILVDRADRFGIADLYQLRGRVGRGDRKGYAYLLLPRHGIVDKSARERIQALRRHSGLGAGFNLAIKDMEIRGAGNILGAAQSGHISAVGFGLYCQLLQRAVSRMQGLPVPEIETELRLDFIVTSNDKIPGGSAAACVPYSYIEDERLRIAIYRRIAEAGCLDALAELQSELIDRFGPPPDTVLRLLAVARIRCLATQAGITLLETRGNRLLLYKGEQPVTRNGQLPRIQSTDPDCKLQEVANYLKKATLDTFGCAS